MVLWYCGARQPEKYSDTLGAKTDPGWRNEYFMGSSSRSKSRRAPVYGDILLCYLRLEKGERRERPVGHL